jgi:hypothetical protein
MDQKIENSYSIPSIKPQLNHVFRILINSYVEGHWKDISSHPHIQNKGVAALKRMQLMCATLLSSDVNQVRVNFTTFKISPQESVTHLLHHFNTSKRQAEEAGLAYTEEFTCYFLISIIRKSNKPEYSVNTNIYMEKRGNKRQIDFTAMESAYLDLKKNRLIAEQATNDVHLT